MHRAGKERGSTQIFFTGAVAKAIEKSFTSDEDSDILILMDFRAV